MDCRLCKSKIDEQKNKDQWTDKHDRTYQICRKCGLIQLKENLFLSREAEKERYLLHENSENNKSYLTYLNKIIRNSISPFLKPGSGLLDFGCGSEQTLGKLLKKRGYRVSTFDPYFNNKKEWVHEKFDAITAIEVFEHLSSPATELDTLSKCLNTGSFLVIRTMLHNRLHKYKWEDFGRWWYKDDPTHVSFYSRSTIEYICKTWNYELMQIIGDCEIVLGKL